MEDYLILLEEGDSFFFHPGPNYVGNPTPSNLSEPYNWEIFVDLQDDFADWWGAIGNGDVTLTLDTGEIALLDFDSTDLELEAGAKLLASGNNTIYADVDRGGTDIPVEGELGISGTETVISRIQKVGDNLLFNDNNNPLELALTDYFGVGGAGNDLSVYLQTSTGSTIIPIANNIVSSGEGFINCSIPIDQRKALSRIVEEREFLFVLARSSVVNKDAIFTARAGNPTFTIVGDNQVVVNKDAIFTARAGNPTFTIVGDNQVVVNKDAIFTARAGNPTFTIVGDNQVVVNKDAIFTARAGNPIFTIAAESIFVLGEFGTLFSGQYVTPLELAVDVVEAERGSALVAPPITDIKNINESLLPFISYGLGIEGNINFLPPNVRCNIIEHAEYYLLNRAVLAVLDQAAVDLEIVLSVHITDRIGGGRNIELRTSPPSYAIGDANWAIFVREFLECLLPWTLNLTGIVIETSLRSELYLHGMISPYNLDFNFGGIARNS